MPEDWGWACLVLIFKTWVLEFMGLTSVSGNELERVI